MRLSRWAGVRHAHRIPRQWRSFQHEAIDVGSSPELRFIPGPAGRPAVSGIRNTWATRAHGGRRQAILGGADGNVGLHCRKFVERVNDRSLKLRGPKPAGGGPSPLACGSREQAVLKPDAGESKLVTVQLEYASREIAMRRSASNHSGEMQS